MNLKCLTYRALDWGRCSGALALFYGWKRPKRGAVVSATGTVKSVGHAESDGDITFHLEIDHPDERGPFRHCELTPCDSDAVRAVVQQLKVGDRISIRGEERFDPHHAFDDGGPDGFPKNSKADGWWEFHYIDDIAPLKE